MSVDARVEEWLRKMGYDGEIPSSLSKICNPSTTFIWEQLISNVKPKQEVEHVRKNIIVNRLLNKSLDQQDHCSYPIKEIKLFMERRVKEKKVESLENHIEETNEQINELLKKNKMLYVAIDHKKLKIKEKLEKKFLLQKKSKIIEDDIQKAQETLTLAKNLTPVEMDELSNTQEVTKTLEKCAKKLQKLTETKTISKTVRNKAWNHLNKSVLKITTTPRCLSRNTTFSKYLNQSVTLNEIITTSKKRTDINKENMSHLHSNVPVNRCLFVNGDCSIRTPKRESLGLLPDNLNISEEMDNFLLNLNEMEHSSVQPMVDSIFESSKKSEGFIDTLCCDRNVKEMLKNLLYTNNRYFIITQWKNIYENILRELSFPLMEHGKLIRSERSIDKDDLTKLYSIHVKTELEKDKNRLVLKKLQDSVKKAKEEVLIQLCNKTRNREQTRQIFELKVEEAYLSGANDFLRREINTSKKIDSNNDIQIVATKIKRVQEEISQKNETIENIITDTKKVLKHIRNIREETSLCVRKLGPLIHDLSWANPMTQETNSKEVEAFGNFPLEFNRKFKMGNLKIPYWKISDTSFPPFIELDSNTAEIITLLIDLPFCTAEDVIFNALKTKMALNKLRLLEESQVELNKTDFKKYSLDELRRREEYVESVINKLNGIINSPTVKDVLAAPEHMKEIMNLWFEAPFTNYISDKRLLDGNNYKFYENALDQLYSSLPQVVSK